MKATCLLLFTMAIGCGRSDGTTSSRDLADAIDRCAPGGIVDECIAGPRTKPVAMSGLFVGGSLRDDDERRYGRFRALPVRSMHYNAGTCAADNLDAFLVGELGEGTYVQSVGDERTHLWATSDGTWIFQARLGVIAWSAPPGSRVDPVPDSLAVWPRPDRDPPSTEPIADTGFTVVAGRNTVERLTHSAIEAAQVWRRVGAFLGTGCGAPTP